MLKDNIKRLRQERGMSQGDLADRVHVVRQTVSKWERGASVPDAEFLRALARELGTTPNDLLGEAVEVVRASAPDSSDGVCVDGDSLLLTAGLLQTRVIQRDRMETIYRWTIAIVAIACVAALAIAIAFTISQQVSKFTQGFEHGFELEGSYRCVVESKPPIYASFGFTEPSVGLWQLADFSTENPINGRFVATADPNLYELQDEAGESVGWASLAYAGSLAGKMTGLIYVQYGGESFRLEKFDRGTTHYGRNFTAMTVTHLDVLGPVEQRGALAEEYPESDDWAEEWFDLDFADDWSDEAGEEVEGGGASESGSAA
ncbi:helix-turn-helix transcriptional regulator [uncultured Adlercreutzia sp.]|uniref:helix-turn-helix domain-containing protein n=1 Tax=uncultured Adlercreutzia sp. TaxID=875803 RepID=UPI0025E1ECFC|nr:helix-turn-helix transcriptional regulator [uncultured Adlercreutzia sp.]